MSTQRLGRYELQERLGHGGMGEVWRALDTQLQRSVAIKLLHANLQNDPTFVTRFEQEARVIASLRHPNIVEIHDYASEQRGPDDIVAYMVTEHVPGQTLGDYIRSTSRKQRFPSAGDLVYLFTAISIAIDYAHSKGTIHRDIKPGNILLDQRPPLVRPMGKPVLIDFGLAKIQSTTTHTIVGSILGTPNYISPEQAQGKSGDHRSDLYSLGIILYEMTTGLTPFRSESMLAILRQHIQDDPTPPALINPMISPELSAVILKSIAKKPEDRYTSAADMTIALAQALNVVVPPVLLQARHSPVQPMGRTDTRAPSTPTPGASPSSWAGISSPGKQSGLTPQPASITPLLPPSGGWSMSSVPPQAPLPIADDATLLTPSRSPAQNKRRRVWRIALSLVALLILVGTGVGLFALFTPHNPPSQPTITIAGQISFTSSTGVASNGYDVLHITLHNVPAPPQGKVYFAWINGVGVERTLPHWQLTPKNGTIQEDHLTYLGFSNLLRPNSLFLITLEDYATGPPTVPNPSAHVYYAKLSSTTTTFDVTSCTDVANSCTSF